MNEMLLSATAWRRARPAIERGHDVAVFYSPSIFFGPLIALLKRRCHLRTYLVLRDIFPDWAVQTGILRKGLLYQVLKVFERLQYSVADRIGVETKGSVEYFRNSVHLEKVELLRNWTRTDCVHPPDKLPLRQELGLENKTVFLYGGNIGAAQDMDNILRLASRMEKIPEAHFILIGTGSDLERLTALVSAGKAKNITILPPVDQNDYLSLISQFDVGLISLDRRLRSFSTTGKLLGYLRCGLAVLASVNLGNDLIDLLRESGAGLCSENGDDEMFYQNALRLCSSSVRTAIAQRTGALLAAEFSLRAAADQILRTSATAGPLSGQRRGTACRDNPISPVL
jgi:hypothetical protein